MTRWITYGHEGGRTGWPSGRVRLWPGPVLG